VASNAAPALLVTPGLRAMAKPNSAWRRWRFSHSNPTVGAPWRRHNENSEGGVEWFGLKLYRGGNVYLLSVRTRRSPQMSRSFYAFILSFARAREAAIWMR
jgi:hypothetical protein